MKYTQQKIEALAGFSLSFRKCEVVKISPGSVIWAARIDVFYVRQMFLHKIESSQTKESES